MSAALDAALGYAARAWAPLPLYGVTPDGVCQCWKQASCPSTGKHPRLDAWQTSTVADADHVRRWYRSWPSSNVGILCGTPGGVVVLDIDPRHGGDASLAQLVRRYGRLLPRRPCA